MNNPMKISDESNSEESNSDEERSILFNDELPFLKQLIKIYRTDEEVLKYFPQIVNFDTIPLIFLTISKFVEYHGWDDLEMDIDHFITESDGIEDFSQYHSETKKEFEKYQSHPEFIIHSDEYDNIICFTLACMVDELRNIKNYYCSTEVILHVITKYLSEQYSNIMLIVYIPITVPFHVLNQTVTLENLSTYVVDVLKE